MAALEPLEVLQARLAQFEAQKGQIAALLDADPDNEQPGLQKMVEDLDKVIEMTNTLIVLHGVPGARDGEGDSKDDDDDDDEGGGGKESDDDDDDDDDDDLENASSSAPRIGPLVEGECIEVASGARVYGGVLVALDGATSTARVKYFEFETEVLLPLSDLRRMAPGPLQRRAVRVGLEGECKYATDNKFYPCTVQALTANGCIVKYTQFGNTEEVPINYLRPVAAAGSSSSSSSSGGGAGGGKDGKWKNKTGKEGEARLLPIPEALQIKDTDTEEEKARKIKKQRVIRNKNRLVRRDQEQKATQQSWQKFVQKGTKRGIVKESSMFATPDEPLGKVGVVGSGKGVTSQTDTHLKKRPKFTSGLPGTGEGE